MDKTFLLAQMFSLDEEVNFLIESGANMDSPALAFSSDKLSEVQAEFEGDPDQ